MSGTVRNARTGAPIMDAQVSIPSLGVTLLALASNSDPRRGPSGSSPNGQRVGDLNFAHVRALVDEVVIVREEAIKEAAWRLLIERRLVVEHSGAAVLAALLDPSKTFPAPVVLVLSGGNLSALPALEATLGAPS